MESLLKSLERLPAAIGALPAWTKGLLLVAALAAIGVAAYRGVASVESYQYAFTNLTPEDSAEAAGALKIAGLPFRLEAGGSALAVPAARVYDARLLLAAAGLPRGGGIGFEIFDRGDLGVSEFTQKVNLRRATEGELARTISRLAQVRGARVHLTLPEKGLYRDQDRTASAAVVVNLQPGRALGDREIAGIRHLVSSAVPGLPPDGVTVVDGRGEVLTGEGGWGEAMSFQRRTERDLEGRVVDLLEGVVGPGAVIARVTAAVDANEVQTSAETVDPEATALRSERRVSQESSGPGAGGGGVAGAAANEPLSPAARAPGRGGVAASTMEDQVRNFDVSRTTTTTVAKVPRLQRISVAVLVDAANGAPRPDAELARLGELAKRAVGFDPERGDRFELTSAAFTRDEGAAAEPAPPAAGGPPLAVWGAAGGGALVVLGGLAFLLRRRRAPGAASELAALTPGVSIAQLEAALARDAASLPAPSVAERRALPDPAVVARERARELVAQDPARAAAILKAWLAQEALPASRTDHHA